MKNRGCCRQAPINPCHISQIYTFFGFQSSVATLVTFRSRFISSQNSRKKTRSKNPKKYQPNQAKLATVICSCRKVEIKAKFYRRTVCALAFPFRWSKRNFFLKKKLLEVEKLVVRKKKRTKIETQHLLTRTQDKVSQESELEKNRHR